MRRARTTLPPEPTRTDTDCPGRATKPDHAVGLARRQDVTALNGRVHACRRGSGLCGPPGSSYVRPGRGPRTPPTDLTVAAEERDGTSYVKVLSITCAALDALCEAYDALRRTIERRTAGSQSERSSTAG